MKICTITCHDVYNHGASLQTYALAKYLTNCGHDVEIIDYKPEYLNNHYNLFSVDNPKWDKNMWTRSIYLALKIPFRIKGLKRKKAFDQFTSEYLNLTKFRYESNDELRKNRPGAEVYICGSDQIWNTLRKNGKDPAFYLDFVPPRIMKASYAASFATKNIPDEDRKMIKNRVGKLAGIGVREKSGVEFLNKLGIKAFQVVDPVFLLSKNDWDRMGSKGFKERYILVYDFDNSRLIKNLATEISEAKGYKIYTVNPGKFKYADKNFPFEGPETFVSLVKNAQFVISNSFHAAVFSIIFEKDFAIVNRTEDINTRMRDLLQDLHLNERLVHKNYNIELLLGKINYEKCQIVLEEKIRFSKFYLKNILSQDYVGNVQ